MTVTRRVGILVHTCFKRESTLAPIHNLRVTSTCLGLTGTTHLTHTVHRNTKCSNITLKRATTPKQLMGTQRRRSSFGIEQQPYKQVCTLREARPLHYANTHVINIRAKLEQFEKEQMHPTYICFVHSWWRCTDRNVLYYWMTLDVIRSNNSSYHYTTQQWTSRALTTNVLSNVLSERLQLTCDCYWMPRTLITTCGTFTCLKVGLSVGVGITFHHYMVVITHSCPFQHGCEGVCLTFHSFYSQE